MLNPIHDFEPNFSVQLCSSLLGGVKIKYINNASFRCNLSAAFSSFWSVSFSCGRIYSQSIKLRFVVVIGSYKIVTSQGSPRSAVGYHGINAGDFWTTYFISIHIDTKISLHVARYFPSSFPSSMSCREIFQLIFKYRIQQPLTNPTSHL